MISEYFLKGIDNMFAKALAEPRGTQKTSKFMSQDFIKANLHTVIKSNDENASPLKKSRLKSILEKNKSGHLKSVIRRDNQRSASPYQRINPREESPPAEQKNDKIVHYREQRKTTEKSRVLEKSRIGGSRSRIFRVSSHVKLSENQSSSSADLNPKNAIRY